MPFQNSVPLMFLTSCSVILGKLLHIFSKIFYQYWFNSLTTDSVITNSILFLSLVCLSTGYIYPFYFSWNFLHFTLLFSIYSFCFITFVFNRMYSFIHCQGITWQIIWFFFFPSYGTYGNWTRKKKNPEVLEKFQRI